MRDTLLVRACILSRSAKPDVWISSIPIARQHLADILRALRQQLPIQPMAPADQVEQVGSPRWINLVVEHVSEGRTEHALSSSMLGLKFFNTFVPCDWVA